MQSDAVVNGLTANLSSMDAAHNYTNWLVRNILRFAATVGRPADMRALDFGAGTGTLTTPLVDRFHALTALEIEERFRQTLRVRAPRAESCTDLEGLRGRNFDLVFSSNVLEHIPDDVAALKALRRTMRRGAGLFVYVPARPELFGPMDRLVGHQRRYLKQELADKVAGAGFQVQSIRYCDVVGYLAAAAHRVVASEGELSERSIVTYDRLVTPLAPFVDALALRLVGKNLMLTATAQ